MSVDRYIDKENVVNIYNGILFCHRKEGNSAICVTNMDETEGDYAKWNARLRKTNIVWYHLYVESYFKSQT